MYRRIRIRRLGGQQKLKSVSEHAYAASRHPALPLAARLRSFVIPMKSQTAHSLVIASILCSFRLPYWC